LNSYRRHNKMNNCIRDKKGRFTGHQFDMTLYQACAANAEYRECLKCGLRRRVLNLVNLALSQKSFLPEIAESMNAKNEVIADLPFEEAAALEKTT